MRQLVYDWDMRLIMNDTQLQTIEQVRRFLEGSKALEFKGLLTEEKYEWVETVLVRIRYLQLKRAEKFGTLETIANQMSDNQFADVPRRRPGKDGKSQRKKGLLLLLLSFRLILQ
ncbi:hypothetical protein M1N50_03890 [Dehalococcoidia bacterium]|nr:hypothetical protein [Dehalococcoidia bacterium]